MSAYADHLDLRKAVIDRVGNEAIVEVFPEMLRLAEASMNRRLRCREQVTTATVTVSSGVVAFPAAVAEVIGLFDNSGREMTQLSLQAYRSLTQPNNFYTVDGTNIRAADAEYTLEYYAKIPTIADSVLATNWVLAKFPHLYLYTVMSEVAARSGNFEAAQAAMAMAEREFSTVGEQDASERFARARVRVKGPIA